MVYVEYLANYTIGANSSNPTVYEFKLMLTTLTNVTNDTLYVGIRDISKYYPSIQVYNM